MPKRVFGKVRNGSSPRLARRRSRRTLRPACTKGSSSIPRRLTRRSTPPYSESSRSRSKTALRTWSVPCSSCTPNVRPNTIRTPSPRSRAFPPTKSARRRLRTEHGCTPRRAMAMAASSTCWPPSTPTPPYRTCALSTISRPSPATTTRRPVSGRRRARPSRAARWGLRTTAPVCPCSRPGRWRNYSAATTFRFFSGGACGPTPPPRGTPCSRAIRTRWWARSTRRATS